MEIETHFSAVGKFWKRRLKMAMEKLFICLQNF